ncbi:unnamed protein product (macronuclear) [Paramecium tetraurelia]|uniref:Uncharacterized protein n=1 Tax=Paramecium tetraurelia TaxID=5888 RepID=A0DQQ8_PARTE|nr:uncharacterized protein GSPATT00002775001 [Paramecium tetraurelia]CAK85375.1 unnamed protein product [Paramecium tetraurelia]|eukprot:XP_001452772.1 hypothetical protein (macronuclear) [Paramecium tetraurelia strain d4-2]
MDPQQTNQQQNKNNAQNEKPEVQKQQEQVKLIQKEKEKCLEIKNKAGTFFTEQKFEEASDLYKEAIDYCPLDDLQMLCILNSNIAICYMKQSDYDIAIDYCTKALTFNPEFVKALINRAESYEKLNKLEDALEDYKKLKVLQPQDNVIIKKFIDLDLKVQELDERRNFEAVKGLKGMKNMGNSVLGKLGLNSENFKLEQNENGTYNISYKS